MKPLLILMILFVVSSELPAQISETRTPPGRPEIHGGMSLVVTPLNEGTGVLAGAGAELLFDNGLAIGASGYGLLNRVKGEPEPGLAYPVSFGYGGLDFRYLHRADQPLHLSVATHIGGGSASYLLDRLWRTPENLPDLGATAASDRDFFFVLEPDAGIEANIGNDLRIGLGASYRFVSGISLPGLSNRSLSGVALRAGFRVGTSR